MTASIYKLLEASLEFAARRAVGPVLLAWARPISLWRAPSPTPQRALGAICGIREVCAAGAGVRIQPPPERSADTAMPSDARVSRELSQYFPIQV